MENTTNQILDGGVQIVPPALPELQTVYLDFDGEVTSYNGEIAQFDVNVKDSGLTAGQIAEVIDALNAEYAGRGVDFVSERPSAGEYSTVFVGKSREIGFSGLAETIDAGNVNRSDNAFVNLDVSAPIDEIVATISHEVGHIVFGETHAGEGLAAYAGPQYIKVNSGEAVDGVTAGSNQILQVFAGGTATNVTIESDGSLYLYVASDTVVNGTSKGIDDDDQETSVPFSIVNGVLDSYTHDPAEKAAWLRACPGGTITNVTLPTSGVKLAVDGGVVSGAYIASGAQFTFSSGLAKDVVLEAGAQFSLQFWNEASNLVNVTSAGKQIKMTDGVLEDFESTEGVFGTYMMEDGAIMSDCTLHGSAYVQMRGGTAVNTVLTANHGKTGLARARVSAGYSTLHSPLMYGTTIGDAGWVGAVYDARLSNTTILSGGAADIGSAGKTHSVTLTDTYVSSGGLVNVYSGAYITGELHVESGATVKINAACTVNFDVTDRATTDDAPIQGFGYITGTDKAAYTLTYRELADAGNYKLADTADFAYTVNATSDAGRADSGIAVGDTFGANDYKTYSLAVSDGNLCLVVADKEYTAVSEAALDEKGYFTGGTLNLMTGGTVAGCLVGTGNADGDVKTTIAGGEVVLPVIGGAKVAAGSQAALGDVTLVVAGGDLKGGPENGGQLYTAGYAYGADPGATDTAVTLSVTKSELKLSGGSIAAENLFAGAHARKGAWTKVDATAITVTDGTYHRIYGGGWAERNGRSEVTAATITVTGGTVDRIYAGGANAPEGTTLTGGATITVGGSADVDFVFLAGKNACCTVTGDVELTLSGDAKSLTRISGRNGCGFDGTDGVTSLNVRTGVTVNYLDYVDRINLAQGNELAVTDLALFDGSADTLVNFELDGAVGAGGWTALSGAACGAFLNAAFAVNGSVVEWNGGQLGDTSYAMTFDSTEKKFIISNLA
ncbi:MAG: autotransporter adhesin family protein [Lentisphaeria bacterium]|nr:autotransporter adhesin family protein [Lentisphaeria bacterium]